MNTSRLQRPLLHAQRDRYIPQLRHEWMLRMGRMRLLAVVTASTVLASVLLTVLVTWLAIDESRPITIGRIWTWAIATGALVPLVLSPLIVWLMLGLVERLEQTLQLANRLAQTDPLTGLSNRRSFMDVAHASLQRSNATGAPLAVVMLDIDQFKHINDTWGHLVGDEALVAVARVCANHAGGANISARLGGEEFALLLHNCDLARAAVVAELMRADVERWQELRSGAQVIPIRVSVGVACSSEPHGDLTALLALADQRLYEAKRSGRNRVSIGRADLVSGVPASG